MEIQNEQSNLILLPTMTVRDIAAWCTRHRMRVEMSTYTRANGQPQLRVLACHDTDLPPLEFRRDQTGL